MDKIKKIWNIVKKIRGAFKVFWENMNKTLKVLIYTSVSIILAEVLIELGGIEQTFIVRVLAQIINVVWIFLEKQAIPAVKERIKK